MISKRWKCKHHYRTLTNLITSSDALNAAKRIPSSSLLKRTGIGSRKSCTSTPGKIITGDATPDDIGREIFDMILRVADGELTWAESLGYREFGIYRVGDTF